MESVNRKCKKCNEIKDLKNDFYKTGIKKTNREFSYQYICKKCYCKRQRNNTDNDIKYFETDFDDLPTEIKLKIVQLSLENRNIKKIAKDTKCKYMTIWYAVKSKQIQKFNELYIRKHLCNN
jgi:hypothetical protein